MLAGCSANVMRLDTPPSFSLNDTSSPMTRPSGAMTRSSAGAGSLNETTSNYAPPASNAQGNVKVASLPEPPAAYPDSSSQSPAPYRASKAIVPVSAQTPAPAPVAVPASEASAERGEAIQVKPGDTLFGLSKRHHASIAELMSVNALTSPNLKPGQTLYLPVGKNAARKPLTRPLEATTGAPPTLRNAAAAAPAGPPTAELLAKYDGSYTVKKGDSLYALALQLKVPLAELQQVNAITDVRKVRPGAVLRVPSGAVASASPGPRAPAAPASVAAAPNERAEKVPAAVVAAEATRALPPQSRPTTLINSQKVASAAPTNDAAPTASEAPAAAASAEAQAAMGKLRWPVKGRVIGSFGPKPDGTQNDGVNLSVPLGTEVHAAESGVIAYAGELKGYGNLILVRHDNGWITAYAHNEELLAKRGDKVKRGQVLAKAGKSGQVDQPQVHFELRQGSKPVDPTPFMEKI